MLARFSEDAARPQPLQVIRPARAPRPAQAGIVIREPPPEGNAPLPGRCATSASPAAGQSGKQKAVLTELEAEDSSFDDDDPQTVAAALARKRSRSNPRTDPWAEDEPPADRLAPVDPGNLPPPASTAGDVHSASIPVQIKEDSSPELEESTAPPDEPPEEPTAGNVPAEEIAVADPAEPIGEGMVAQEPAPYVPEIGAGINGEPEPDAAPVVEPQEVPAAAAVDANAIANVPPPEPPNRLERLVRILEVAPPGVIDEARDGLQRLLGPDIGLGTIFYMRPLTWF
ncbi:fruit protein pKIWI501-like [Rosa chinensis]|uniref:fruit protein pKIWI501-like n=1 Tax=Rosa chinensis TaxID=74649 RepID=UPI000D08FEC2|nr:fruit protein pKIWI501-like [Rosa chinensis]